MKAQERLLHWFEENHDREVTVKSMKEELDMREPTVHKALTELHNQGLLARRVGLVVRPNLSACKQYHYKATDRIKPRAEGEPAARNQSLVERAIQSRGALLDAWWPIKAANQQQHREAA